MASHQIVALERRLLLAAAERVTLPSDPQQLFNAGGGTLLFSADDGVHGHEMWRSDGTAGGTVMVKDFVPGAGNGFPQDFTRFNGSTYFLANSTHNSQELWATDGTTSGTRLIKDLGGFRSDDEFVEFPQIVNRNGTLFMEVANLLYKSDGTAGGTVLVKQLSNEGFISNLAVAGDTVFFSVA